MKSQRATRVYLYKRLGGKATSSVEPMAEPSSDAHPNGDYTIAMDETNVDKPHPLTRRSGWLRDDAPPEGQRAAMHRLAAAIRRINNLMVDTAAPEPDLIRAAEAAEQFATRLERFPSGRLPWGFGESSNSGNVKAMFDQSPLLGLANPVAPPLYLRVVDGVVRGTVTFGGAYEGPPGHVHGGFVAAAFDEALGMAQSLTGNPGMTGTLTVRYRQPTPLHRELTFLAQVDRVEGRKIFTTATLHAGDRLCAEAEGIFVSVDFDRFRVMAEER